MLIFLVDYCLFVCSNAIMDRQGEEYSANINSDNFNLEDRLKADLEENILDLQKKMVICELDLNKKFFNTKIDSYSFS